MSEEITKTTLLEREHTEVAATITDVVKANLPREKAIAERQMAQTAKEVKEGLAPSAGDGRGQPLLSIPPIVYMRWQQAYPGCWKDEQFCAEFAFDNPQCCLPGYNPRPRRLFFQMKYGNMKLNNYGGDFYHENRARINAEISNSRAS